MNRKINIIVTCTLLLSISFYNCSAGNYKRKGSSPLSFAHALGGSYYIGGLAAAPGITYSPRLNFYEFDDDLTLSVGSHIGLGFLFSSQSGVSSYALDLPLVAEINYGHAANPNSRSSPGFGVFAGAGLGVSYIGSAGAFGAEENKATGIVLNGGIRALIKEKSLGVRISYLLNFNSLYSNVLSFGFFYTFGDY